MFKSVKKTLALLLTVAMLVASSLTAFAAGSPTDAKKPVTAKGATAVHKSIVDTNKNGTATLVKLVPYNGKTVKVPTTVKVNGVKYKLVTVNANAFKLKTAKVKTVKLGKNVKTVKKNAFKNCKKLKTVTVSSKKITFNKKAFGNLNTSKITIKVSKKAMSAKAFKTWKTSMKKWFKGTIKRA